MKDAFSKIPLRFISLWFVIGVFISGCSMLPFSHEIKDVLRYIEDKYAHEPRFNLDEHKQFQNQKLSNYLNRLSKRVCEHYNIKPLPVVVSDSDDAQGMIIYDTKTIYISRGMLFAVKNEAELISLLAHEVGHIFLRHDKLEYKEPKSAKVMEGVLEEITGLSIPGDVKSKIEIIKISQFSRNMEQGADEFAVSASSRLGYNAYEFTNLLERLHQLSDGKVLIQLQNLRDSHQTLIQRATHLRSYLREKNIGKEGLRNEAEYLSIMRAVFKEEKRDSKINVQADQRLDGISGNLNKKYQAGQNLSPEEFLHVMNEIRLLASNLKLLSYFDQDKDQRQDFDDSDEFMMELVRVKRPWWWGSDHQLMKIRDVLSTLARMGVGTLPVVGDAVDLYEFITGRDFVSGEKLNFGERVSSGLGVVVSSGAQWRATAKGIGDFKFPTSFAIDSKEGKKVAATVKDAAEKSPIFRQTSRGSRVEELKELQAHYRLIKNEENYEVLMKLAKEVPAKKIPDGWKMKVSKYRPKKDKYQGLNFTHPENKEIRLRVMPGDPNSQFPNSRQPYVRQTIGNKAIDRYGKVVNEETDDAHIPLKEFIFKNFWKDHVKK